MASSWEGLNHCMLRRATPKALMDAVGQSCFGLQSVIVGSNINVGSRIFSTVEGLSSAGSLSHGFVKMLLSNESPMPASQAEKDNINMGVSINDEVCS